MENDKLSRTTTRRWKSYCVPYNDLPEEVKELDRSYARKVLDLLKLEK